MKKIMKNPNPGNHSWNLCAVQMGNNSVLCAQQEDISALLNNSFNRKITKKKREKQQKTINILKGDNLAVSEQKLDT